MLSFAEQEESIGLVRVPELDPAPAPVSVRDPNAIRLLQLTDLHFFADPGQPERDRRTRDDLERLLAHADPDLLLVTGDLWHENPGGQGARFMREAIAAIEALDRPWLFVWGNHDKLDDYREGHRAFTEARGSHYRGGHAGGNYNVPLHDRAGRPLWDLLCLNSNQRGLGAEQLDWLREFQPTAPHAFAIFHVPLKQFDELWQQGHGWGVKLEPVWFEHEDGAALDVIRAKGGIRACFVGHDHVNDYAIHADGIDLVYGRATGHAGYGGELVPKGAKVITVHGETGEFDWYTLHPDGSRWREQPGQRWTDSGDMPWPTME